jgi:hypothetical protein
VVGSRAGLAGVGRWGGRGSGTCHGSNRGHRRCWRVRKGGFNSVWVLLAARGWIEAVVVALGPPQPRRQVIDPVGQGLAIRCESSWSRSAWTGMLGGCCWLELGRVWLA